MAFRKFIDYITKKVYQNEDTSLKKHVLGSSLLQPNNVLSNDPLPELTSPNTAILMLRFFNL